MSPPEWFCSGSGILVCQLGLRCSGTHTGIPTMAPQPFQPSISCGRASQTHTHSTPWRPSLLLLCLSALTTGLASLENKKWTDRLPQTYKSNKAGKHHQPLHFRRQDESEGLGHRAPNTGQGLSLWESVLWECCKHTGIPVKVLSIPQYTATGKWHLCDRRGYCGVRESTWG